jgi:hypothetical protein
LRAVLPVSSSDKASLPLPVSVTGPRIAFTVADARSLRVTALRPVPVFTASGPVVAATVTASFPPPVFTVVLAPAAVLATVSVSAPPPRATVTADAPAYVIAAGLAPVTVVAVTVTVLAAADVASSTTSVSAPPPATVTAPRTLSVEPLFPTVTTELPPAGVANAEGRGGRLGRDRVAAGAGVDRERPGVVPDGDRRRPHRRRTRWWPWRRWCSRP